jgi:hypothetical protein
MKLDENTEGTLVTKWADQAGVNGASYPADGTSATGQDSLGCFGLTILKTGKREKY